MFLAGRHQPSSDIQKYQESYPERSERLPIQLPGKLEEAEQSQGGM